MRVRVYRNLNKHCYSVLDPKTGLVVDYADEIVLDNVTFVVRPGGHARAVREQRRNVHAFAVGIRVDDNDPRFRQVKRMAQKTKCRVSYNPFRGSPFFEYDDRRPLIKTSGVLLNAKGVWLEKAS